MYQPRSHEELADNLAAILRNVYNNNPKGYVEILQLLADAKPISSEHVAAAFGYPKLLVKTMFYIRPPKNFDFDDKGNIIGSGLTYNDPRNLDQTINQS